MSAALSHPLRPHFAGLFLTIRGFPLYSPYGFRSVSSATCGVSRSPDTHPEPFPPAAFVPFLPGIFLASCIKTFSILVCCCWRRFLPSPSVRKTPVSPSRTCSVVVSFPPCDLVIETIRISLSTSGKDNHPGLIIRLQFPAPFATPSPQECQLGPDSSFFGRSAVSLRYWLSIFPDRLPLPLTSNLL